jgi:YesN/AraC family two-component response regulator
MKHRILIIDDEKLQVENLAKAILSSRPTIFVDTAYAEDEITKKISDTYFNIAIVDLRMDAYSKNGFDFIKGITQINPFAKIIIVSAFLKEYEQDLNEALKTGKIAAIIEKENFNLFKDKIIDNIDKIIAEYDNNPNINQKTLEYLYSDSKNETDNFRKGTKFEYFTSTLFNQMGFNHINKRVIDASRNEVDIIVRNEIFFLKNFVHIF